MNIDLEFILVYAILIPGIVALFRLKQINRIYYPFICLIWMGIVNEIISYITGTVYQNNAVNNNIYSLCEALIILILFKRWHLFDKRPAFFTVLFCLLILMWFVENFVLQRITDFNSYFTIAASFLTVLMSITLVNQILVSEKRHLARNPTFIICICFILFYSYSAAIEIFWKYEQAEDLELGNNIFNVLIYLNLLIYTIYTYAILCMRRQLRFTMPS